MPAGAARNTNALDRYGNPAQCTPQPPRPLPPYLTSCNWSDPSPLPSFKASHKCSSGTLHLLSAPPLVDCLQMPQSDALEICFHQVHGTTPLHSLSPHGEDLTSSQLHRSISLSQVSVVTLWPICHFNSCHLNSCLFQSTPSPPHLLQLERWISLSICSTSGGVPTDA